MPAPPVAADHREERLGANTAPSCVYACRYTYTAAQGAGHEWNHVAILDNHSDSGESCAVYHQANKYGAGRTWAACSEVCDQSFGAVYGPMIGHEVDVWCNGADPAGWRMGLHVVGGDARRIKTGDTRREWAEIGTGLRVSHNGGDHHVRFRDGAYVSDFWQSGLRLDGSPDPAQPAHRGVWFGAGAFVVGFDFSGATFQTPIRLGAGQFISLEATDSVKIGFDGGRVRVTMLGQPIFELDVNTGDLYLRGQVRPL